MGSIVFTVSRIVDTISRRRKCIVSDIELDLALVGPPCSGKTTLFELLMNNKFRSVYSTTVDKELGGVEYVFAKKESNGRVRNINVKVNIWSLAGQNNINGAKYRRAYLRGIDVLFYVVDGKNMVARSNIAAGVDMYLKYAMKTPSSPIPVTGILLNKSDLLSDDKGNTNSPLTSSIVSRNMYRVSRLPEWIPRRQCKSFLTSFKNGDSHTEEEKSGYFGSSIGSKTDIVQSGDVCETLITWAVNRHLNTGEELTFVKKL